MGADTAACIIELPEQDPLRQEHIVGRLAEAMYGTWDARQIWAEKVRNETSSFGLLQEEHPHLRGSAGRRRCMRGTFVRVGSVARGVRSEEQDLLSGSEVHWWSTST